MGPPVARLGRLVGWDPVPLTVREARRIGGAGAVPACRRRPIQARRDPGRRVRGSPASRPATAIGRAARHRPRGRARGGRRRHGAQRRGQDHPASVDRRRPRPVRGRSRSTATRPEPGVDVALCPQEPEVVLFAETVGDEVRATRQAREPPDDPCRCSTRSASPISSTASSRPLGGQRLLVATAAIAAARRPCSCSTNPRGDSTPPRRTAGSFPAIARRRGWRRDGGHPRRGARRGCGTRVVILAGGEVVADGDPGQRARRLDRVRAADDPRVRRGWLTPEQVAEVLA